MGEEQREKFNTLSDLPPAPSYKTSTVWIERWKKDVTVRELSGNECELYQRVGRNPGQPVKLEDLVAFLQAAITNDGQGQPFASPAGAERLKVEPYAVLLTLFTAAMNTSSLTADGVETEKKD